MRIVYQRDVKEFFSFKMWFVLVMRVICFFMVKPCDDLASFVVSCSILVSRSLDFIIGFVQTTVQRWHSL